MPSYTFRDEVFSPSVRIGIEYYGENPFRIYHKLDAWLQENFYGRGQNVYEDHFRWDTTSDPRKFFFEWRFQGRVSRWSTQWIRLRCFGYQPVDPKKKDGSLRIEFAAELWTTYSMTTQWQMLVARPFIWLHLHVLYAKVRRRYIRRIREGIERVEKLIREDLGLEMREMLTE